MMSYINALRRKITQTVMGVAFALAYLIVERNQ